jgi:hypothetical protein
MQSNYDIPVLDTLTNEFVGFMLSNSIKYSLLKIKALLRYLLKLLLFILLYSTFLHSYD